MNCDICIEVCNKSVICPSCKLNVCLHCFDRYHMESTNEEVQCMKCNKHFDDDYIFTHLSRKWLDNIKNRKKGLLFEREQIHFPETQIFAQYDRHVQTYVVPLLKENIQTMMSIHRELSQIYETDENITKETMKYIIDSRQKLNTLARVVNLLKKIVNSWNTDYVIYKPPSYSNPFFDPKHTDIKQNELIRKGIPPDIFNNNALLNVNIRFLYRNNNAGNRSVNGPNKAFEHVFACSERNCKGFVMKKDWKCGICDTSYCKKCFKLYSESHTCLHEDVKSAELVLSTSKPCPKCAVRIHKISGCDQMFCTHCKTAFSWKTLEIETGIVHNPHFFEWQNRGGHDVLEFGGCGRPHLLQIINHCERMYRFDFSENVNESDKHTFENIEFVAYLLTVHRLSTHITGVEILRRFGREPVSHYFNIDLRIKYLNNTITEDHFKKVLHRRFKAVRVNLRRVQILQLFVTVTNDILNRFLTNTDTSHEVKMQFFQEFEKLFEYVGECFGRLSKIYGMGMPNVQLTKNIKKSNPRMRWDFQQDKFTGFLLMKKYK